MLKQVQHDIFHHFPCYNTASTGKVEGENAFVLLMESCLPLLVSRLGFENNPPKQPSYMVEKNHFIWLK